MQRAPETHLPPATALQPLERQIVTALRIYTTVISHYSRSQAAGLVRVKLVWDDDATEKSLGRAYPAKCCHEEARQDSTYADG
jgi:hypothetical protein